MASETAAIDQNSRHSLTGVTNDASQEIRRLLVDPTTGRLLVSAIISVALDDLSDVVITAPANGDVLTYNSGTGRWVNQAPSSTGITIGTTPLSGGTQGSVLFVGAATVIQQDNANFFWDDTNNWQGLGTNVPSANLDIVQPALVGATPQVFELTGGAHTNSVASTEITDINFNLARTVQFAAGTVTTERSMRVQGVTYAFVGASTITTASTLEVNPPVAGTNATLTTAYAIMSTGLLGVNRSAQAKQISFLGSSGSISTLAADVTNSSLRLSGNRSAASAGGTLADVVAQSQITRTAGGIFAVLNNGSLLAEVSYFGGFNIAQAAASTGTAQALVITNASHTSQTAGTEVSNIVNTDYTRSWAASAITTQREVFFGQPTYAFASASTITTAATVYIKGEPLAGANATITTPLALWIDSGNAQFDGAVNVTGALTVATVAVPTISSTSTLTNKRVTKRTGTVASSATPTINTDNVDFYSITALAAAITSMTTNLSGTPTEAQTLWIAITDNGTARAITWGASFEASGTVALPTTTVISTRLDVGFVWNTVTSKWRCVATA